MNPPAEAAKLYAEYVAALSPLPDKLPGLTLELGKDPSTVLGASWARSRSETSRRKEKPMAVRGEISKHVQPQLEQDEVLQGAFPAQGGVSPNLLVVTGYLPFMHATGYSHSRSA